MRSPYYDPETEREEERSGKLLVSDARVKEIDTERQRQRETGRRPTDRPRKDGEAAMSFAPGSVAAEKLGGQPASQAHREKGRGSCQGLFHSNRPLSPSQGPLPHAHRCLHSWVRTSLAPSQGHFFPGNVSPCPLPQGRMGTQRQHGRGSSHELLPNTQPEDLGVSQLADCSPKPSFTPAGFSGPAAAPRQLPTIRQGRGVQHFEGDWTECCEEGRSTC